MGSVAGIFAAVWVGYAAIRAENKRIAARGRVAAFRLAPNLVNILGDVGRARGAMAALQSGLLNRPFPEQYPFLALLRIAHCIPPDVFAESWTLPAHIALSVSQLDNAITNLNARLDNVEGAMVVQPDEAAKLRYLSFVVPSLDAIERQGREAQSHAAAVSDAVARQRRGE